MDDLIIYTRVEEGIVRECRVFPDSLEASHFLIEEARKIARHARQVADHVRDPELFTTDEYADLIDVTAAPDTWPDGQVSYAPEGEDDLVLYLFRRKADGKDGTLNE